MKTKTFFYRALVGLSLCVVLIWSCRLYLSCVSSPKVIPMKTAEVRQTLEKCSSETEIQAEVDSLFVRFGDKDWKILYDEHLSTTPGLVRFGNALNSVQEPALYIELSGYDFGVPMPSHVRIRFGQHSHYQHILIFRTGSDLSSISSPFEQVTNNVYFKP